MMLRHIISRMEREDWMGPSFSSSIEQRSVILFLRVFPAANWLPRMSERVCVILFVISKFLRTNTSRVS
jgi:hypothetical protein